MDKLVAKAVDILIDKIIILIKSIKIAYKDPVERMRTELNSIGIKITLVLMIVPNMVYITTQLMVDANTIVVLECLETI